MPRRPPLLSFALLLVTTALGLAVRFGPLGLPPMLVKYGGSFLWALAIYWLLSSFTLAPRAAALASLALAASIEFFKLVRTPALDHLRLTLPGILLLGRIFSFADIGAYGVAILCGLLLDTSLRSHPASTSGARPESSRADHRPPKPDALDSPSGATHDPTRTTS